jgi:hypothetical protein
MGDIDIGGFVFGAGNSGCAVPWFVVRFEQIAVINRHGNTVVCCRSQESNAPILVSALTAASTESIEIDKNEKMSTKS